MSSLRCGQWGQPKPCLPHCPWPLLQQLWGLVPRPPDPVPTPGPGSWPFSSSPSQCFQLDPMSHGSSCPSTHFGSRFAHCPLAFYYSGENFSHLSTLFTLVGNEAKPHVSLWGPSTGVFHSQTLGARGCLDRAAGPAELHNPVVTRSVRTAVWALGGRPTQWHAWVKTVYWGVTRFTM